MISQSTFLILAPVADGRLAALRTLLAEMNRTLGMANPDNALLPFARFERLHMARLFVVEVNTWRDIAAYGVEPRPFPPQLAFMGDIDGERTSFLAELAQAAPDGLKRIFAHCEGFSPETDLLGWMQARNVEEAANYVNTRGRTVRQVHEVAALCKALRAHLPVLVAAQGASDAGALYAALQAHIHDELRAGRLTLTPETPPPFAQRLRGAAELVGLPLALILLSPLAALAAPFAILRLRQLENSDPEVLPRPDDGSVTRLAALEDYDVTNAFTAAGDLKPGRFRRGAAMLFLFLLNYAARNLYGRGYLTRVQSIHFARWIFLDDRRRILFCSNYDGSLESYMDDFINKVAWGLNLVFSNGVGYPSTRYLLKGGAEHETKFKRFLRNRQLQTDVWYKAYPGLTAFDLAENTLIRRGFDTRPESERATRRWLARL